MKEKQEMNDNQKYFHDSNNGCTIFDLLRGVSTQYDFVKFFWRDEMIQLLISARSGLPSPIVQLVLH